jgi:hypothetical protein
MKRERRDYLGKERERKRERNRKNRNEKREKREKRRQAGSSSREKCL